MEAKEYLDLLKDENAFIRLSHYSTDGNCDGRGNAVILDEDERIAVMVEDCGSPECTLVKAGAIVKFATHPEMEPRISGSAAYFGPTVIGGRRV